MGEERMLIHEKVYVVLGNEMQEDEGLLTLNWVVKKWGSSQPISIVLVYIITFNSNDIVATPFGKLPARAVSDEMLQHLRKCEHEKIDKLLSKYVAFCGKVATEVHKVEKQDQSFYSTVVESIITHRMAKLVMGVAFLKSSSSGNSNNGINGLFYVHRNKPEFCQLYILCKGKLMILKEANDEGHLEDENGVIVAKLRSKHSFRDWFGRMLSSDKTPVCPSSMSPTPSLDSSSPRNHWDRFEHEIEDYFQELLAVESKSSFEQGKENGEETESIENGPTELDILNSIQDDGDKIEALKKVIQATNKMMESNKNKAKAEVDRQAKASWSISLCNHRAEYLEGLINEEISTRNELNKELDNTKEQLLEITIDVKESKNRLGSLLELQSELSAKLQAASLSNVRIESQLQSMVSARLDLVREIEEFRKQRDVFKRRIEFCKEKDAIGMANKRSDDQVCCSYREFSADEIRLATDNFAAHRRLKSCGDWTDVYKGLIKSTTVAIKMLDSPDDLSQEFFRAKVDFLGNIRHPYITALIGFCDEFKCLVFEYMHNGCLRDIVFSRTKSRILKWHHRIQIAARVSSVLGFLHMAKPRPIVYLGLNPSSIFLDRNLVAKILALELTPSTDEADMQANVSAFGVLLLQLLTGRNWAGLNQDRMMLDKQAILEALDDNAGSWPLGFTEEVIRLAMKCWSAESEPYAEIKISSVSEELNRLSKMAGDLIAREEFQTGDEDPFYSKDESSGVPKTIVCPILQVVMENPHIAADGYSYEYEAIDEWLRMGHDTSPLNHSKLAHKHLVPNISLRLLIQDWHHTKSCLSL